MKYGISQFVLWVCLGALFFFSCGCSQGSTAPSEPQEKFSSLHDFVGRHIGSVDGSVLPEMLSKKQDGLDFLYYSSYSFAVESLRDGKVDAVVMNHPIARLWDSRFKGEFYRLVVTDEESSCFIFPKGSPLKEKFNQVLKTLKESGDLEKFVVKWCDNCDDHGELVEWTHNPSYTGEGGVLNYVCDPIRQPYCFIYNGKPIGLDLEILNRVCYDLNMTYEFHAVNTGSMVDAVVARKMDNILGSSITWSADRAKRVDFSEEYYRGGLTLLVKNPDAEEQHAKASSLKERVADFGKSILTSFRRTFVEEKRWQMICQGLGVTLLVTVCAVFFGTILAFPLSALLRSKKRFLHLLGQTYVVIFQGTPVLVVLMILYYMVFVHSDLSGTAIAIIGFSMNFAAYVSEMLKTGIDGVPAGQTDAALALGFSRFPAFLNVVLPQAVRSILPVYRGECVSTLKSTSIVGYIAIQDLTKVIDIIRSRTYEAFFPLISMAVIYFTAAWGIALLLSLVERRMNPVNRRNRKYKV